MVNSPDAWPHSAAPGPRRAARVAAMRAAEIRKNVRMRSSPERMISFRVACMEGSYLNATVAARGNVHSLKQEIAKV